MRSPRVDYEILLPGRPNVVRWDNKEDRVALSVLGVDPDDTRLPKNKKIRAGTGQYQLPGLPAGNYTARVRTDSPHLGSEDGWCEVRFRVVSIPFCVLLGSAVLVSSLVAGFYAYMLAAPGTLLQKDPVLVLFGTLATYGALVLLAFAIPNLISLFKLLLGKPEPGLFAEIAARPPLASILSIVLFIVAYDVFKTAGTYERTQLHNPLDESISIIQDGRTELIVPEKTILPATLDRKTYEAMCAGKKEIAFDPSHVTARCESDEGLLQPATVVLTCTNDIRLTLPEQVEWKGPIGSLEYAGQHRSLVAEAGGQGRFVESLFSPSCEPFARGLRVTLNPSGFGTMIWTPSDRALQVDANGNLVDDGNVELAIDLLSIGFENRAEVAVMLKAGEVWTSGTNTRQSPSSERSCINLLVPPGLDEQVRVVVSDASRRTSFETRRPEIEDSALIFTRVSLCAEGLDHKHIVAFNDNIEAAGVKDILWPALRTPDDLDEKCMPIRAKLNEIETEVELMGSSLFFPEHDYRELIMYLQDSDRNWLEDVVSITPKQRISEDCSAAFETSDVFQRSDAALVTMVPSALVDRNAWIVETQFNGAFDCKLSTLHNYTCTRVSETAALDVEIAP